MEPTIFRVNQRKTGALIGVMAINRDAIRDCNTAWRAS